MNKSDIRNKSNASVHNAVLVSPPTIAFPIWAVISVVSDLVVENMLSGSAVVCPITIATANASPNALARPSIIPENIPEAEAIGTGDLEEALEQGYLLMLEPASRLLYTDQDGELLFWANGESICISAQFAPHLKKLADGQAIALNETLFDQDILEDIAQLMNESVLMLLPADSEE